MTLLPSSSLTEPPTATVSAAEIAAEGLKPEEYAEIVRRLGRHPNRAELGMFGVMWSEHCCYKNSRPLLRQFPTTGSRILVGPGENAGVVDLGDGFRLAFKIESHNHPSAIEPFQGAATGVGGILRDIFTMGARPIAILNSLRFGNLEEGSNQRIFSGVVEGISHYGNCLSAHESFIWRDQREVHFDTIGNFVNGYWTETGDRHLQSQDKFLETLSFDPQTGKAGWQPITRLFKRVTNTLITLKMEQGYEITLTPDHPCCIIHDQNWQIKASERIQTGDRLPFLFHLFHQLTTNQQPRLTLSQSTISNVSTPNPSPGRSYPPQAPSSPSIPRHNPDYAIHHGTNHEITPLAVIDIQVHTVQPTFVYDVEVGNTHLFVTTSGLITHNCVGVPTIGGEVYFDPVYSGNPLVNAMALGLMETETIVKSGASGIGNPVLYVGSTTGRDGMGGASFASAELTEQSTDHRPAVQVGDPFIEKSLIEACLEAFKTGAVVAAQDMGAAGITCSTAEMAAKGGVGIDLDLDLIPVRETGMVPYEYLLSESQERMLLVAENGREQELIHIFKRWGLEAVVAGTVISEPVVRIHFQGEVAAEIPATALADDTPVYHRHLLSEPPPYVQQAWAWSADTLPTAELDGIIIQGFKQSWTSILLQLLHTPNIGSKRWVYRQYDHQVQNNTVILPGVADAAVIRIRAVHDQGLPVNSVVGNRGVAATVDCNARYVYLDPYEGAKAAVAEAARNLSCVGAEPLAVTDNLNFGSPENPIGYWQLAEACRGLAEGCRHLGTPVTGGNVSLYNETLDSTGTPQSIYPTPVVGMVGLIPDLSFVTGQGWQFPDDLIYLIGWPSETPNPHITLGGSEYLYAIHGRVTGKPPLPDLHLERQVQSTVRYGIRQGWLHSAHDCAEGGLAVALAEACISGELGAEIDLSPSMSIPFPWRIDHLLFGEGGPRILVSLPAQNAPLWETWLMKNLGESWQYLGKVKDKGNGLQISIGNRLFIDAQLSDLEEQWSNAIARRLSTAVNP